jgi:glycosyltransferase involved in cell wall biosynthesis
VGPAKAVGREGQPETDGAPGRRGGFRIHMNPKFSVVLPVYNREEVLPRAIKSVLGQKLEEWELIVIDDGSTDGAAEVARSFGDNRVRLLRLGANRGGNAARNAGIREAKAPLISFLDSDDAYLPEKLERTVAHFDKRPDLDLLVDSFIKVRPPGSARSTVVRRNPVIEDRETFRRALFTRLLWKATPAMSVKREAAMRAGLFDESLKRLQDFDFLIRISEFANCASTDEVLWTKYWDSNAISAQDTFIPANIEIVRRHPEFLSRADYRPGLGYALRLSLWRKLSKADLGGAWEDVSDLAQAFGGGQAAKLVAAALRPRPRL